MPDVVSREEIAKRVIAKIEAVAEPDEKVDETDDLEVDLGMTSTIRAAMALPYSKISKSFPSGLPIRILEARALGTVKQSIDLVHKRSNGRS